MLASGSGVEAHISPDGARVMAVLESGFGSNLQIESWPFAGSTSPSYDYYPTLTGGWGPGDVEISDCHDKYSNILAYSMCVLTGTPKDSGRVVAKASNSSTTTLFLPTVSPDGTTVAVEQITKTSSGYQSTIELYKYATGALIRNLTHGTSDQYPSWSPNGGSIAFQRGTGIYTVPSPGGTPKLIVKSGKDPTWG